MSFQRSSGILLHPTSLPGRYGIGELGDEAFAFVDFLEAAGQTLWQVLPLGPTGFGDSPYACFSAFAGNPLLVSLDSLVTDGLLSADDLNDYPQLGEDRVNFGEVVKRKNALLTKAFQTFQKKPAPELAAGFEHFCAEEAAWLDDYALFRALKDHHQGKAWNGWEKKYVIRERQALHEAHETLHDLVEAHKFAQYLFFKQWKKLKTYANDKGIKIIGDIPIFVAYDSTDVWTYPDLFKLDKDGNPTVVAGVPPDYFSETGQLWGNPLYNWENMKGIHYHWWVARLQNLLRLVDIIRLDHFRGFAACWEVPANEKTAKNGKWVEVPGREFFTFLKETFEELPIIAEDLGVITPDVAALRDDFEFPGMRILQFAFAGDAKNHDLPHNYLPNTVVYTGTHDNDTTVGWFNSEANSGSTRSAQQIERERNFCLEYLNIKGEEIHWDFIRTVMASVSVYAIVPVQDLLGLGSEARMNLPASEKGNWNWRYPAGALTDEIAGRLKRLGELYGRAPFPTEPEPEAEVPVETVEAEVVTPPGDETQDTAPVESPEPPTDSQTGY